MRFANRTLLSLAAVAVATGLIGWAAPAHAVTNLLVNPGFEDGAGGSSLAGWTSFGNAFAQTAADGVNPNSGTGMLKMFGTFPGVSGVFQTFPAVPGTVYQMNAWGNQFPHDALTGGQNTVIERIAFFDAGGNEIQVGPAQQAVVDDGTMTPNNWVDAPTISVAAPAGAVTVQPFLLFIQSGFQGGSGLADDATFGVAVPEPASLALCGLALPLLMRRRG